jgi:hypothetical protein
MHDTPDARRIPDQLKGALVGYEVSMERLRAAVTSYVEELKARGCTPEEMIVQLRGLLSAIPRWAQPTDDTLPEDVTVVDRAVQWAIEAFYQGAGRTSGESVA